MEDVSFEVKAREWFGLLGPNGAGKTTFCDILLDITTPSSGHIWFDGHDVNREHDYTRGRICTMQYQFFRERVSILNSLRRSAAEWMLEPEEAEERIRWLVDLFDLRDKLDDWMIRLSWGMRMKVWLIATLMSGAELLVFDEPTPGMDVFTRKRLYSQLAEFQRKTGTTIFWTTHNLHEAQETCDRIAVISNRLITLTTPRKLIEDMEKSNLEEAFMALLEDKVGTGSTSVTSLR